VVSFHWNSILIIFYKLFILYTHTVDTYEDLEQAEACVCGTPPLINGQQGFSFYLTFFGAKGFLLVQAGTKIYIIFIT